MSRFRKLTLDEAAQEFEVLDPATCRSLKGRGGTGLMWQDPNDPLNAGLYSMNQFNQMIGDNYGIMPLGLGTEDNPTDLYEVRVTANYCDIHNKFFGLYSTCNKCDEYAIDSQFYDARYSGSDGYTYDSYNNNSGNTGVIGGGGPSGSGGLVNLPSPLINSFIKSNNPQSPSSQLCLVENITQVISTLEGKQLKREDILESCAKAIKEKYPETNKNVSADQIEENIKALGILIPNVPIVLEAHFEGYSLSKTANTSTIIDSESNRGHMVFGMLFQGKDKDGFNVFHSIVIVDITQTECTYYDPMYPNSFKQCQLSNVDNLYVATKLK